MKGSHTGNKSGHVRVELKYCEHCGGLWVREGGAGVYCEKCQDRSGGLADPAKEEIGERGAASSPANCVADDLAVELPEDKIQTLKRLEVWHERRGMDRSRSRRARERDRRGFSALSGSGTEGVIRKLRTGAREKDLPEANDSDVAAVHAVFDRDRDGCRRVLGREFFRAKVTTYTVVTFEDRVIFVHDMETCLDRAG